MRARGAYSYIEMLAVKGKATAWDYIEKKGPFVRVALLRKLFPGLLMCGRTLYGLRRDGRNRLGRLFADLR